MPEITIYTTPTCPYCHAALALLRQKGVRFEQIDVAGDREKRAWLRDASGRTTVPQVFVAGEPYGGYTDLLALERAGELDAILRGT